MASAIQITITSNDIGANLAALAGKLPEAQTAALTNAALLLRDTIVSKYVGGGHPDYPEVQTGRLKASIRYTPTNPTDIVYVGSDAEYAPYVEYGHAQEVGRFVPAIGARLVASSAKPYPFMRPAISEVFDGGSGITVMQNAVKEVLGL